MMMTRRMNDIKSVKKNTQKIKLQMEQVCPQKMKMEYCNYFFVRFDNYSCWRFRFARKKAASVACFPDPYKHILEFFGTIHHCKLQW